MKVGEVFIYGRTPYMIVSIFEDNNQTFYVAKSVDRTGFIKYSNIFTYNEEGKLYKRT